MINCIVLIGRLTADPELRYTSNGTAVCRFSIAVNRDRTNAQGEREVDFINIVAWRGTAETCSQYLKKGRLVGVEGRLQINVYKNQEGRTIRNAEVIAESVQFLENNKSENRTETNNGLTRNPAPPPPSPSNSILAFAPPYDFEGKPIEISDDDLPF